MHFVVRPFTAADIPGARALLDAELARGNPYAERARSLLDATTPVGEYRAVVAERGDGAVIGIAVYGAVAGTEGAGVVYALAVDPSIRRRGVGRALADCACADLAALGSRFALMEVPDDHDALPAAAGFLTACDFVGVGRVDDLYRDGVGLIFMQRQL